MVVTNVIRFDHQARPYYLGRIHCRVQSIITGFKEIAIAIWTLIYPSSSVLEWFGEQHRSAPFKNMFFYHGYRAPLKNVRFYSILTLCFASLLLIADVIMLIITIKFYKYYHDWRIARKNGGETIAYASRISDPSSLPQTQTVNVDN
ncbi:hypothetical protein Tcan_11311 [Toxocara canis]|uniref:Uncharacterized protein n=1 Tax=Toxocara canis TaxID=6265 RepID=A0A0B2W1Y9_TOXCA|nr:hypothetical protein Tcan_11312 [Toxocara canis]KHN87669.1 hypothetical protein Tcan_11311 [Toxocara canis]